MRIRSIVIALAAVIAVGGFSAYAANSHGLAVSILARTTTAQGVLHGEAVSDLASLHGVTRSAAVRAATPKTKAEATESEACEAAEAALKTDKTEDVSEHAATTVTTAATVATKATDRSEDLLERARAEAERDSVKAACAPVTLSAACQAAIDALKALRTADRAEDKAETRPTTAAQRAADRTEDAAERQARLAAVRAMVAACVTER